MRIIEVIWSLRPEDGGPREVVLALSGKLAEAGHDVSICYLRSWPPEPGFIPPPDVTLHACRSWPDFARTLRTLARDADVIHSHGIWEPSHLCAAWICRLTRTPFVTTVHGMLHPWELRQRRLKKWFATVLLQRRILNRAQCVVALTNSERAQVAAYAPGAVIEVVPNGVGSSFLQGPARPFAPPQILYYGRIAEKKGLQHLIGGFAQIATHYPRVRLRLIGPATAPMAAKLRAWIAASPFAHRIVWDPAVWGAERARALVDAANILVLPSMAEGMSLAVLEAMAAGLPVVISEPCGFPEAQSHGCGLVIRPTAASVAAALKQLLTDPKSAAAMGARGRAYVAAAFNWKAIADRTLDIYRLAAREATVPDNHQDVQLPPPHQKSAVRTSNVPLAPVTELAVMTRNGLEPPNR